MADPTLSTVLAQFTATVQRNKNRMLAIPAEKKRELGLTPRPDNHLLRFSIRKHGAGRWNHHYAKLTRDNEIMLPSDLSIQPGNLVDVKVHRIIADLPVSTPRAPTAGSLLLRMAEGAMADDSRFGASQHDDALNAAAARGSVPRKKHGK